MSRSHSANSESSKPFVFTVWTLADRKRDAALLVFCAAAVVAALWYATHSWAFCLFAAAILFLALGKIVVPVRYEINSDGIQRECWGFHRLIAWNQIQTYQIRSTGIFLLPPNDRFYLEAFRGFFLPVPASLSAEILYRFRLGVEKQE